MGIFSGGLYHRERRRETRAERNAPTVCCLTTAYAAATCTNPVVCMTHFRPPGHRRSECDQPLLGTRSDPPHLDQERGETPNSKHWFTTSFLQLLPYSVTPSVLENCLLTSSFFGWCSNCDSSKLDTNNSNKTRRVIYSRQQKVYTTTNRLNRDGTSFFHPGWTRLMFTWVLGR